MESPRERRIRWKVCRRLRARCHTKFLSPCGSWRSPCSSDISESATSRILGEKLDECGVDLLRMRPRQAVRAAFDLDVPHAVDHLRLPSGRDIGGQNAVVVAVNHQGRQIVARDVLAEILKPRVHAGHRSDGRCTDCHGPVGSNNEIADSFSIGAAHAVEVLQELHHRGRTIGLDPGLELAEHAAVNALRIVGRLNQIGSKSPDEYGFAKSLGAELADVPRDFAGAHRVPDQRNAGKVERAKDRV
jgi:hypothetical protein